MDLNSAAVAAGVRLIALDSVGSTNAEALALARSGERGPLWITAREQTAGRGRRGRPWVSWPGNLYATLFLLDPAPPARAPELSFVSALALHDALTELASGVAARLTLKWPNDLLLDGAKVAGILIEGEGTGGDGIAVAVGIGVNCVHHPADTPYPATDLASAGARVQPEALFRILSATMLARLTQWQRGSGFAAIRRDWLARADGVGAPIRVRSTQIDASGIFEDLDSSGRLVLGMPDGTRQMIGAGEVFPVLAASPFVQPDGARQ